MWLAEGSCLHEEYQGAWKVAINQGVVLRLKLHYRQTNVTTQLMYSGRQINVKVKGAVLKRAQ